MLSCALAEEWHYAPLEKAEREELQREYSDAYTMLDDKSISDVSGAMVKLYHCVDKNYLPACPLLLDVYEGMRKGLEADPEKAFQLAAHLSDMKFPPGVDVYDGDRETRTEAMYRLALYYERGFGCDRSLKDAYAWMRQAAQKGYRPAQAEIARYLMNGIGHKPDSKSAFRILYYLHLKAPETPNLYFYLGCLSLRGINGSTPNVRLAKEAFEHGAALHDARAINNLASLYEHGVGVKKNVAQALRLYKQAADLGSKDASANMQRLNYKTDKEHRPSTTWKQRFGSAAVRVLNAMPMDEALRLWLESPLRLLAAES